MELEKKAKDSEYYRGRVDGLEYIIDAIEEAYKSKGRVMKSKEYKLTDGTTVVFEYDENGVGKITLECMDILMRLINDRKTEPQKEETQDGFYDEYYRDHEEFYEPQTKRSGE